MMCGIFMNLSLDHISFLSTWFGETPAPQSLSIDDNVTGDSLDYSLLSWSEGILKDLGFGLGWAACYFTFFTAGREGQTPGKKLMKIRVQQLDGKKISLWAAFGRYGGYGAGFATGLLGFIQIYWDANRQAIQDKISATVVIDMKKAANQEVPTFELAANKVSTGLIEE